jgi:hypothetical protein
MAKSHDIEQSHPAYKGWQALSIICVNRVLAFPSTYVLQNGVISFCLMTQEAK